jgi:uncharacterized OB-fold protein
MTNQTAKKTEEKVEAWVPVQKGLFEYPLKDNQRPALKANRCSKCGETFFPKKVICPYCLDQQGLEELTLDGQGTVYSSTVVHIPSPTGIKAPYAYGYVDMVTLKIRVFALFTGDEPTSFTPGRAVELILEPIKLNKEGQEVIGYKFRPVSD